MSNSNFLVADNIAIQKYIKDEYNRESEFISYGAEKVSGFQRLDIEKYLKKPGDFILTIASIGFG